MEEKTIKFTKQRDFSDTISDTFSFIRNELKPLFKVILIYVGPFLLITGFFSAWYQSNAMKIGSLASTDLESIMDFYSKLFNYKYFLLIIGSSISSILLVLAVLSYIKLYKSVGSKNFESTEVWEIMKQKFFPILGGYILIGLIVILGATLVSLTAFISPVITAILGIVYFIFGIYFAISVSLFVATTVFEDLSVIASIKRSMYLVKNYWWVTLGVLFISSLIASIAQAIFMLPQTILNILALYTKAAGDTSSVSSSILLTIFTVIGTFGSYLLYTIPFTTIAIHYHSQVEKKENTDLINKIEDIK